MTAEDAGRAAAAMEMEAMALAGWRAGKSMWEIAIDIYGREQVDADWHADSWMRAKIRRLLYRAEARVGAGPGTE